MPNTSISAKASASESNASLNADGVELEGRVRRRAAYDPLPSYRASLHIESRPSFQPQYATLYYARLQLLGPAVEERARSEWIGDKVRILDAKEGVPCWVVGTVYVDSKLKPNVLDDISRDMNIATDHVAKENYWTPDNTVYIEDESGRVPIIGDDVIRHNGDFVTGVVMALLGMQNATGQFVVKDAQIAGLSPQAIPLPRMLDQGGVYVALVSGLHIGAIPSEIDLATQMLLQFLRGDMGSEADQELASRIVRVVVAGNSVGIPRPSSPKQRTKRYSAKTLVLDDRPLEMTAEWMSQLAESCPVDMMPGDTDPAERMLPQRPIQADSLFPETLTQFTSFQTVPNPYWCAIENIRMLTTSGQMLNDAARYALKQDQSLDRLKLAMKILRWRHLAPTAPDTLYADPFVLEETPHIFACGNQPYYHSAVVHGEDNQKVRVILVPEFRRTGSIVLVRLDSVDLECREVKFRSTLPGDADKMALFERERHDVEEEVEEDLVVIEHGLDED